VKPAYFKPGSLAEALQLLDQHGDRAKLVAGGTALTLLLGHRLVAPEVLVDLSGVPDLNEIEADLEGLRLGSMVTLDQIQSSADVRAGWPAFSRACRLVGNVRIRNQATLGGNLAEADYASDPPAVLLALDARLTIAGPKGVRTEPISDFILGFYTTTLAPNEVITHIQVPRLPSNARMTYLKFKTRSSEDRPCVGVAVVAALEGQECADLRVAVGAASDAPRRLPAVEEQAAGGRLTDGIIAELASAYADQIDTLEDLRGSAWYRKEMIRVLVARALRAVRDDRR
jgi:carbon-monoxide dehydrogenase medium subunit